MSQITTLTFFRYEGFSAKVWALGMMQFAHKQLATATGLSFYKLMGSGKGLGFNPLPDWSTYALLQVWDSQADAEKFMDTSVLAAKFRSRAAEMWTVYMGSTMARGQWSGTTPFTAYEGQLGEQIAVITRATIRPSKLYRFWKYVPTAQRPIASADGLLYTKGIGEVPVIQMATFSIWKSKVLCWCSYYSHKSLPLLTVDQLVWPVRCHTSHVAPKLRLHTLRPVYT